MCETVAIGGHDYRVIPVPETFPSGGKIYGARVDHDQRCIFLSTKLGAKEMENAKDMAVAQARAQIVPELSESGLGFWALEE